MSDCTHETLRRIFELAAEAPPDQRAAILDRECSEQPEVRNRIEAMLDAVDDPRFLASPTATGTPAQALSPFDLSGGMIGPYTLVRLLGEGGFGSVYLARQSTPIARGVAIKVLRPGMDSREVLARFDQERQALAMMDHPNIARVLDAGTTPAGQPFVVMDLVDGEPLVAFCDAQQMSVRGRLELFSQVCSAVQHAHTKGIIHRDLKPSNVLVTVQDGKPVARVIDFGIAKAVTGSAAPDAKLTVQQQFIGTPEYMSPEQAQGSLDLDTRTDVYSLGVLLYELLTGSTPFTAQELRNSGYDEMQRLIREVDPPNPSTRLAHATPKLPSVATQRKTEPQRLWATVRGELDWIVMKAIEKDRHRRYDSPSGLAADIARYLSGEPVVAAPPGAAYRVRKFVRRHRVLVASGLVAAGGLVLGATGFAWQASMARAERDTATLDRNRAVKAEAEATKRAEELERVAAFQSQMIVQVDPSQAGVMLGNDVRSRLDRALERDGLSKPERDAKVEAFTTLWNRVNATDAARSLINSTILAPAVKAIDEQFKDQPAIDAALCHALADVYDTIGMRDAAMPLAVRALEIRRRVLGNDAPATLSSINNMAYLLQVQGQLKEADPLIREVLERKRRVLGEEHKETIVAISNMGTQFWYTGDLEQAERYYREALDKSRRTLGEGHEITIRSVQTVAMVLRERRELAQAEELLRDTMQRSAKELGPDHQTTIRASLHLSSTLRDQGRLPEAESLLQDASARAMRTLGESHPLVIEALGNLGANLSDQGKYEQAEPVLRGVYATSRRVLGEDDLNTFLLGMDMAELLLKQRRYAEAEPIARDVLERRRRTIGPANPVTLVTATTLARILNESGKHADAEALLASEEPAARKAWTEGGGANLGPFLVELGRARMSEGRYAQARDTLHEAHQITAASRPAGDAKVARAARALADLYTAWDTAAPGQGHAESAAEWVLRAAVSQR